MPRAAIDIGSNSLLLTVLDDAGHVLVDEATVVGLSKGVGDRGLFAPDRMQAAEEVLSRYLATAQSHAVPPHAVRAVATSGARRAMNATTWLQSVQRHLGLHVEIISGDEEARLAWAGSRRDLDLPAGPVVVIDLGGGSTEVVLGEGDQILGRASLEIGSVRLTERFLGLGVPNAGGLAQLRNAVDTAVATIRLEPLPASVIGTAGSVTTLAAMALGLDRYDGARVHGRRLTREHLAGFIDAFATSTPEQRRARCAVSPDRADFLLAGAAILERLLTAARRDEMLVSDRGLRFGLLAAA